MRVSPAVVLANGEAELNAAIVAFRAAQRAMAAAAGDSLKKKTNDISISVVAEKEIQCSRYPLAYASQF